MRAIQVDKSPTLPRLLSLTYLTPASAGNSAASSSTLSASFGSVLYSNPITITDQDSAERGLLAKTGVGSPEDPVYIESALQVVAKKSRFRVSRHPQVAFCSGLCCSGKT